MMKEFTIYAGEKAELQNGTTSFKFECKPDDTDKAYDILAENIKLNNQDEDSQDLIDFQNCDDSSVENMLKDLKHMQFIDDYDVADAQD